MLQWHNQGLMSQFPIISLTVPVLFLDQNGFCRGTAMANITVKGIRESTYEAPKKTTARFTAAVKEISQQYRGKIKETPLNPKELRKAKEERRE